MDAVGFSVIEPGKAIAIDEIVKVRSSATMQAPLAPGIRFFRVVMGLIRKRFAEVGGCFTGWIHILINSSVYPSSQPPSKQIVEQLAPDTAPRPLTTQGRAIL
jgi:hypothetical protein